VSGVTGKTVGRGVDAVRLTGVWIAGTRVAAVDRQIRREHRGPYRYERVLSRHRPGHRVVRRRYPWRGVLLVVAHRRAPGGSDGESVSVGGIAPATGYPPYVADEYVPEGYDVGY
jgi:hypothetical protein